MTLRPCSVALAAILTAGCASTPEREIPTSHPAHLAATEAPAPPASATLAIRDARTPVAGDSAPARAPAGIASESPDGAATIYTCAHHPEVVLSEPGKCPKCGMKLQPKVSNGRQDGGHP